MRPPGLRFTIRRLMLVVALVGLAAKAHDAKWSVSQFAS
jgi:hypothetical protein